MKTSNKSVLKPSYHPEKLFKSLKVAKRLRAQAGLGEQVADAVGLAFWDEPEVALKFKAKRFQTPSRWTLKKTRMRLDCACMLQRQEVNKDPAIRRQLFYDASQQHYLELFVVREFVHTGTAAGGLNRILPLTSLGVGHFTAIDKALALLHSISLESGRRRPSMQRHVDSVRVQAIDGGAES